MKYLVALIFGLGASLAFAQSGVSDPVGANDENGDGKLSIEEFGKIPVPSGLTDDLETRFDQTDLNDDGFVDREEMAARRASRQ